MKIKKILMFALGFMVLLGVMMGVSYGVGHYVSKKMLAHVEPPELVSNYPSDKTDDINRIFNVRLANQFRPGSSENDLITALSEMNFKIDMKNDSNKAVFTLYKSNCSRAWFINWTADNQRSITSITGLYSVVCQ
jgi:hypothetical protein